EAEVIAERAGHRGDARGGGGRLVAFGRDQVRRRAPRGREGALGDADHEPARAAVDLPMDEARRVAGRVAPELNAVAVLEAHRMRVVLAARERGEEREPTERACVRQEARARL